MAPTTYKKYEKMSFLGEGQVSRINKMSSMILNKYFLVCNGV